MVCDRGMPRLPTTLVANRKLAHETETLLLLLLLASQFVNPSNNASALLSVRSLKKYMQEFAPNATHGSGWVGLKSLLKGFQTPPEKAMFDIQNYRKFAFD